MRRHYLPDVVPLKTPLFLLAFLALFYHSADAQGLTTTSFTTPGANTWTAPCGVTSVTVELWGGGGAGGGATTTNPAYGGGGSGGAYTSATYTVVPGTTYNLSVGSGGAASTTATNGGNPSWFVSNTTLLAVGGAGGTPSATSTPGAGAAAVTSGNIGGTVNYYGGAGGTGTTTGGGGGSSAGNAANGIDAIAGAAGAAVTGGGAGAAGQTGNANGAAGSAPGGGGAGARRTSGSRSGGAGGTGRVSLTYTQVSANAPTAPTATSITTTSAVLGWTAPTGTVTNYTLQWRTSPSGTWTVVAPIAGTTYTLTGLAPNTAYDFQVADSNGTACASPFTATTTFTTNCSSVTTFPFTESFDAIPLSHCWTAAAGSGATYFWGTTTADGTNGVSGPYAGSGFAYLDVYDALSGSNPYTLTSPVFVLPAAPQQLSYYYYLGSGGYQGTDPTGGTDPYPLSVQITTDGGATWTDIYDHSTLNSTFASSNATSNWHLNAISLAAYANATVQIRFVSASNYGNGYTNQGIDQFTINTLPTCFPPTALTVSSIFSDSAVISWTAPAQGTPAGYQWEVVPTGAGPYATPVATNFFVGTGTTASTGTGLSPSTTYDVYVKTGCSLTDTSTWSSPVTFTTSCVAITSLPWTEGFEGLATTGLGIFPQCWSTVNLSGTDYPGSDNGTIVGTTYGGPHTGTNFLYSKWSNTAWVFTPGFQLTAGTSYDFSFFMENKDFTAAGDFTMDVAYGTSPSVAGMTNALITANQCTNTTYQQFLSSFTPATSGIYYFGVKSTAATSAPWYLSFDDFSLALTPACSAPNALVASTPTSGGATISWAATPGGAIGGYNWEVVASGGASTGPVLASGSTAPGVTSAIITGLTPNTPYTYYVQSNCGGSSLSPWSAPGSFSTTCVAVTSLPWTEGFEGLATVGRGILPSCWSTQQLAGYTYYAPGTDNNTLVQTYEGGPHAGTKFLFAEYDNTSWVFTPGFQLTAGTYYDFSFYMENAYFPTAGNFTVDVKYGTTASDAGMTNSLITGNQAGNIAYQQFLSTFTPPATGVYYFGVKTTNIGFNGEFLSYDDFALNLTPACAAPTTITTNATAPTSATIAWSATPATIANGSNWEVVAQGTGSAGTVLASGTTAAGVDSAIITGLASSSTFDFYVQANCGGSTTSTWTGPQTFSTSCVNIPLPVIQGFNTSPSLPNCWTQQYVVGSSPLQVVATSTAPATTPQEGSSYIYWNSYSYSAGTETRLVSPPITTTGTPSVDISFYWFNDYTNYTTSTFADEGVTVQYSTDGINWTNVQEFPRVDASITTTSGWFKKYLTLPTAVANQPTVYIGFLFKSEFGDNCSFDNLNIFASPPCAGFPDSLAVKNITYTGATGSWTNAATIPAGGYNWIVVAGGAGYTATPVASGNVASSIDSAIITGLAPNTNYDFYVQSYCGAVLGAGVFAGPVSFHTPCVNSVLPLIEGFNDTLIPSCWTQQYINGTVNLEYVASSLYPTTTPEEGSDFVWWNSAYNYQDDTRLVSPPLTTTGTANLDLQFYWFNDNSTYANYGPYLTEGVTVQYSYDNVNWTDIQFFPRQDNTERVGTGSWKKKLFTLPAAVGNQPTVYIGFKFHSEDGDNCSMDNIRLTPSLACVSGPSVATVSNVTTSTATLTWTAPTPAPASGYNWVVVAAGDSATGTVLASGSTAAGVTTASVTGLTANTAYDAYVQSNCGTPNGSGFWVGPSSFSTECNAITSLPWHEGFEGLGTSVGVDLLPPCWLGTPKNRWTSEDAPMTYPPVGPRSGSNYLYDSYQANDTVFTPNFALTAGQQYEFYFYYQTAGYNAIDSIYAMYGNSQDSMTTRIGNVVVQPGNTNYVKYSAIFTPATSGNYAFGVKLASNFDYIAFDDFGLQPVIPCPNPPLAGTISGPTSVCNGAQVNLSLTGYSPYTTLTWEISIDSLNWTDIPGDSTDQYTDYITGLTYYRVKVNCNIDSSYSSVLTIGLNSPTTCYCTSGLGGFCGVGDADLDSAVIAGTTFNVHNTVCNTTSNGAYTAFPQTGDSTATLQRGGSYNINVGTNELAVTSVWIDYNQDGQFTANEWVQPSTSATSASATLSVPTTALLGRTGMRIRSRDANLQNGSGDACLNMGSGDTWDFLITIGDTTCLHTPTVIDTITNPTCFGNTNGAINLSLVGASGPYANHWNTVAGDTTLTLTGLAAGTYIDTISFGNGCTYLYPVVVTQPAVLSATDSIIPVLCHGGTTGGVAITITGGTLTYTSHWSNGSTAGSLTGVAAGIYTDTITDSHGCRVVSGPDTVTQTAAGLATVIDSTHSVKCHGGATGAIYTTSTGGTSPYTYLWSNPAHATTDDVTGLTAGTYSLVVTDHNLCTATVTDSITQPAAVAIITDSVVNTKCHTSSDGSIYVAVTGGTLPYTYAWTGGSSSLDLFFKGAGAYTLSVTDKNGCTATATDTITSPTAVTVSSTISNQVQGGALGTITLTPSGGTSPFTYAWSAGGSTTNTNTNLTSGVYTATVTDKNGCATIVSDTVKLITGIIETKGDIRSINIYPNPSSAIFNVVLELSHVLPVQMEVYSITGQAVMVSPTENTLNNTYQIDMSGQAEGVYFIKVTAGDNTTVQKITVVR